MQIIFGLLLVIFTTGYIATLLFGQIFFATLDFWACFAALGGVILLLGTFHSYFQNRALISSLGLLTATGGEAGRVFSEYDSLSVLYNSATLYLSGTYLTILLVLVVTNYRERNNEKEAS